MKLIYCTSITYPSTLANRLQILAMAKELGVQLKNDFYLGGTGIKLLQANFNIINFKITKSYLLAWKYLIFIQENKIDHAYCRESKLLFFLILYNKLFFRFNLKFIYEIHAITKQSFLNNFIDKFLVKFIDKFIFITSNLHNIFSKKYYIKPNDSLITPDGVDLTIFDLNLDTIKAREKLNLPQDKKIIGYCGRLKTMNMDKGISDILSALKLLDKNILFVAVGGKNQEIKEYMKQAEVLQIKTQVIFLEHCDQTTVALYQKAFDVLLMPFPHTEHYAYYMSPLKMFEYMASKRPIIATNLPSIKEILNTRNAFLISPNNPEDLAKKINYILENKEEGQKIAEQAYQDVKNYTWEKRVKSILEFIK